MKLILVALGSLAVALAVGIFVVLDADVRSIQLLGLSMSYRDVALHALGEPAGTNANINDFRPFCGPRAMEEELRKPSAQSICLSFEAEHSDGCNPVEAHSLVPTYVFPWDDLLETNLAIVSDDVEAVANYLQSHMADAISEIGPLSGSQEEILGQSKTVTAQQCGGYGYVYISQKYHSQ